MSYANGFEDACELCLYALAEEEDLCSVRERIEYYPSLAKEKKMEQVRQLLGALR